MCNLYVLQKIIFLITKNVFKKIGMRDCRTKRIADVRCGTNSNLIYG